MGVEIPLLTNVLTILTSILGGLDTTVPGSHEAAVLIKSAIASITDAIHILPTGGLIPDLPILNKK